MPDTWSGHRSRVGRPGADAQRTAAPAAEACARTIALAAASATKGRGLAAAPAGDLTRAQRRLTVGALKRGWGAHLTVQGNAGSVDGQAACARRKRRFGLPPCVQRAPACERNEALGSTRFLGRSLGCCHFAKRQSCRGLYHLEETAKIGPFPLVKADACRFPEALSQGFPKALSHPWLA
jgi:hypothetical protein